jgi:crotonobetainyl-CoA:carnitine CoA-transferase CaiB-like acyl-CoA transferase
VCGALGLENLTNDPRFDSIEARSRNAGQLVVMLDEKFAAEPRAVWLERLNGAGCICTPVQTPKQVADDPQALANNYFVRMNHHLFGETKMVGFPWSFSDTPASCRRPAPELGEHTEEILNDLGYTAEEISNMRKDGII